MRAPDKTACPGSVLGCSLWTVESAGMDSGEEAAIICKNAKSYQGFLSDFKCKYVITHKIETKLTFQQGIQPCFKSNFSARYATLF